MSNSVGPVQLSDKVMLIGGAVVLLLVIGALWYAKREISKAAGAVADTAKGVADYVEHDAVNITSNKNLVTTAVNAIGQATGVLGTNDYTGKPNTVGSAIYDAQAGISSWLGGLL